MKADRIYAGGMDTYLQDDKGLIWWGQPQLMRLSSRRGDLVFVPKDDYTSSPSTGGFYIPIHPLCFDIVQLTTDCITFISYNKKSVIKFIKLAQEIEKKYKNISPEQMLYVFKTAGMETCKYDLANIFSEITLNDICMLYNLRKLNGIE